MKSCNLQLDIDKSITSCFNLSCARVTLNNKKREGGLEIPSQHMGGDLSWIGAGDVLEERKAKSCSFIANFVKAIRLIGSERNWLDYNKRCLYMLSNFTGF